MIPEGLITHANEHVATDNPNLLRPTFGHIGSQSVEFKIVKEFSGADSMAAGQEISREKEVCVIKNDKFCSAAILPKDLSLKQKHELAGLYEQFRSQKGSTDTRIAEWQAITDQERGFLLGSGIYTVEQLHAVDAAESYKLGPAGDDLKKRASWHMKTKNEETSAPMTEIQLLLKEKAELKAKAEKAEADYFALQAQIAAQSNVVVVEEEKKKAGRPPKAKEI
jgi:hypothetical protein